MQEVVLYYRLTEAMKKPIIAILSQLDVRVKELHQEDAPQCMGYLLDIPGYEENEGTATKDLSQPFLFFAHFSQDQLDLILEVFKQADVPYIPYKAMLTNDNIVYTFEEVYTNVEKEYLHLTNQIDKVQ